MNRTGVLAVLALASLALLLRWPALDRRPMHNDEAVNAVKFGQLWESGRYRYDPNEHHGPSLYFATLAWCKLTGAPRDLNQLDEARLRLMTVFFGVTLVLLLPLVRDGLGRQGMLWAGLFTAVSPAMVFYSRYYIHEVLLVCFTFLVLAAGWRWWRTPKVGWALVAGSALGLMAATKETYVISLASLGVALLGNHFWNRRIDASAAPQPLRKVNWRHGTLAAGMAAIVLVLFFTSFFTNAAGLADSLKTFLPWMKRAGGDTPHQNPWYFFLQRLLWFHPAKGPAWTEGFLLMLACVAAVAGFWRRGLGDSNANLLRILALYTGIQAMAYSVIPYKTPWCLLSFWHSTVLLAGVGAAIIASRARTRAGSFAWHGLLILGSAHLGWEAWQLNQTFAADRRNPYVYAHTSPDTLNLIGKVNAIARAHPDGNRVLVKVISADGDYWPLPWYLRKFDRIGYWEAIPPAPYAPIMVVSSGLNAALDEKQTHLMTGYFELRPQVFLELYVEKKLWERYLELNPPKPDPE